MSFCLTNLSEHGETQRLLFCSEQLLPVTMRATRPVNKMEFRWWHFCNGRHRCCTWLGTSVCAILPSDKPAPVITDPNRAGAKILDNLDLVFHPLVFCFVLRAVETQQPRPSCNLPRSSYSRLSSRYPATLPPITQACGHSPVTHL